MKTSSMGFGFLHMFIMFETTTHPVMLENHHGYIFYHVWNHHQKIMLENPQKNTHTSSIKASRSPVVLRQARQVSAGSRDDTWTFRHFPPLRWRYCPGGWSALFFQRKNGKISMGFKGYPAW